MFAQQRETFYVKFWWVSYSSSVPCTAVMVNRYGFATPSSGSQTSTPDRRQRDTAHHENRVDDLAPRGRIRP